MAKVQTVIRRKIVNDLADLKPNFYSQSSNGSSQYIKFGFKNIGSLRISDHPGRTKYKYKWNIIVGSGRTHYFIEDEGITRFFFNEYEVPVFYRMIRKKFLEEYPFHPVTELQGLMKL